jgi:hypothetical protein
VKKQLIHVLEFLLARVKPGASESIERDSSGRAKNVTPNNQNPASGPSGANVDLHAESRTGNLDPAPASQLALEQAFPDVTLAGISATSKAPKGLSGATNLADDPEPPSDADPLLWALNQARWRLNRTEQLLLNPLPESVREANLLVEEVGQQVQRLRRILEHRSEALDVQPYMPRITEFQQQLSRVSRLLEGAKRAQWARIRWVGALVQTYTPGGRARLWNPFPRTWTVDM